MPGIHHAQRWEGLSGLTRLSPDGDTRAIPLWFEPAPSPTARAWEGMAPRSEGEAGMAVAVVEWPDMAALRAWYDSPEYAPAREIAATAMRRRLTFLPGTAPAA